MPAETEALLRSVRTWLRAVAFVLGLGVVALADIGYAVSEGVDSTLYAGVGVGGGLIALVAGTTLLAAVLIVTENDDRPTRDAAE
jgi:hypothetical protein